MVHGDIGVASEWAAALVFCKPHQRLQQETGQWQAITAVYSEYAEGTSIHRNTACSCLYQAGRRASITIFAQQHLPADRPHQPLPLVSLVASPSNLFIAARHSLFTSPSLSQAPHRQYQDLQGHKRVCRVFVVCPLFSASLSVIPRYVGRECASSAFELAI